MQYEIRKRRFASYETLKGWGVESRVNYMLLQADMETRIAVRKGGREKGDVK